MLGAHQSKSILIVENEVLIADDIARVGYELGVGECHIALNYNEAVIQFNTSDPALLVLDVKLRSERSGIDFGVWVRAKMSGVPIIYVTVCEENYQHEKMKSTSPLAFIKKPFIDEQLKRTIHQGLCINEP